LIRRPLPRGKLRSRSFCITGRTSSSQGSVARILPVDFQNALCPRLAREFPSTAATSALDSATEAGVVGLLDRMAEGATLIVATHKTAVLPILNRLLVFNNGMLAMEGPRDLVLARLSKKAPSLNKEAA